MTLWYLLRCRVTGPLSRMRHLVLTVPMVGLKRVPLGAETSITLVLSSLVKKLLQRVQ